MPFTLRLGAPHHSFPDQKILLAKASPKRSGDVLAGVAARDAEERVAAQMLLAEVPLKRLAEDLIIPCQEDAVLRGLKRVRDLWGAYPES